jgi:hypothetical protein
MFGPAFNEINPVDGSGVNVALSRPDMLRRTTRSCCLAINYPQALNLIACVFHSQLSGAQRIAPVEITTCF